MQSFSPLYSPNELFLKFDDKECGEFSLQILLFYYNNFWQVVKDDLAKHRASLKDSATVAERLLATSDDPVAAAELESRLSRAELDLNQIDQKIKEREDSLQIALSQSGLFEGNVDDFLRWLTKTERTLAKLRPISADLPTVQEQKDSYQVSQNSDPVISLLPFLFYGVLPKLCSKVYCRKAMQ